MPSYKGWFYKAKSDLQLAEKGVQDDDLTLERVVVLDAINRAKKVLAFVEKSIIIKSV